ncbi:hypothetical protein E2C01_055945 [Portunus trituberculatus]|uniref:Secreted protein n=1 Tax=Portunus trituberculatus TaxID=210409 RepID=A0A5B7GYB8_PORTR|nr:hypothetical protein [Portunus trituberculatus]
MSWLPRVKINVKFVKLANALLQTVPVLWCNRHGTAARVSFSLCSFDRVTKACRCGLAYLRKQGLGRPVLTSGLLEYHDTTLSPRNDTEVTPLSPRTVHMQRRCLQ